MYLTELNLVTQQMGVPCVDGTRQNDLLRVIVWFWTAWQNGRLGFNTFVVF